MAENIIVLLVGAEAQAAEEPPGEGGGFEFGDAELARLNALLSQYQGTHNFSNFATKVNASDSNAKRHILSVACPGAFALQVRVPLDGCV